MNHAERDDQDLLSNETAEPDQTISRRKLIGLVTVGTLSLASVAASQVLAKYDGDRDYGGDDDNDDDIATGTADQTGTPTAADLPKAAKVAIKDKSFHPDPVLIATGGTVTWTNDDPVTHNVVGDFAKSDPLAPGDTFKWTFDKAGTWEYACTFHVNMNGTVEVKDEPDASPVAASPQASDINLAVDIKDFSFDPGNATVPAGARVTWTNRDATAHTVTGTFADSGSIAPGKSFAHTFDQAGDFAYVCSFHSNMKATITVTK